MKRRDARPARDGVAIDERGDAEHVAQQRFGQHVVRRAGRDDAAMREHMEPQGGGGKAQVSLNIPGLAGSLKAGVAALPALAIAAPFGSTAGTPGIGFSSSP